MPENPPSMYNILGVRPVYNGGRLINGPEIEQAKERLRDHLSSNHPGMSNEDINRLLLEKLHPGVPFPADNHQEA